MDADRIRSLLDQAGDLLEAGKPAETLRCLEQVQGAVIDTDDRIECATLAGWALTQMGRVDESLELLDAAVTEHPDSARLHAAFGAALLEGGDLDAARHVLEAAAELDESDEVAVAHLGQVCEQMRDYEAALKHYQRAAELGVDLDWVLPRLATTCNEAGDAAGARATLKRYLSLAPDDASQWISLAIMCSEDELYEEAEAYYQAAERLEPDSPWLRLNWGVTAVHAENLKLAREQLERLRLVAPDSSRPRVLEAFVLEEEGEPEQTAACYLAAIEQSRTEEHADRVYALEWAMDFFARQANAERVAEVFAQAYADNACTVELCEAYREATGRRLRSATWFSVLFEADYRSGLLEVRERRPAGPEAADGDGGERPFTRYAREMQVVAPDRDAAAACVQEVLGRMGETGVAIREFAGEEPVEDTFSGVYEIEPSSFVLRGSAG